jgi:hypothetical protein
MRSGGVRTHFPVVARVSGPVPSIGLAFFDMMSCERVERQAAQRGYYQRREIGLKASAVAAHRMNVLPCSASPGRLWLELHVKECLVIGGPCSGASGRT